MFWNKRGYTLEVRAGKRGKFRWWAKDELGGELCQGPVKGFETELQARCPCRPCVRAELEVAN